MLSTVELTRRVTFSSGHRYWFADLSADENRELFGLWASPYSHGHNYVLEVTVAGHVDPRTGMVVNIKAIDALLKKNILSQCEGKSLNDEVPYFATHAPSVENILRFCHDQIEGSLPAECQLQRLKLEETPTFYGEYTDTSMTLTRTYEFAAAHRLHSEALTAEENIELFGKCNNPAGHGHNYELEVTVEGSPDPRTGMLIDLSEMDEIVDREVVDRYDHKHLNVDVPEFQDKPASSENIALEVFARLAPKLPAKLSRIRLHENPRNVFTVEAGKS